MRAVRNTFKIILKVQTYTGVFENAAFSMHVGLSSTFKRRFRSLKTEIFKTPAGVEIFKNSVLRLGVDEQDVDLVTQKCALFLTSRCGHVIVYMR